MYGRHVSPTKTVVTPISTIYSHYNIMPNLQEHQLRVAAVAFQIGVNLKTTMNVDRVVTACLLHDMGNILKFKLESFPDFLEPEGLDYWQGVKNEYAAKYGPDEHIATLAIVEEIGIDQATLNCVKTVGFTKAANNSALPNFEHKLCCYADQRVGPYGVLSLADRLEEGRKRYEGRAQFGTTSAQFTENMQGLQTIEEQLFSQCNIRPSDITDQSIAPLIAGLLLREI